MSAPAEQLSGAGVAPESKTTTIAALKGPAPSEAQLPEVSAGFNSLRAFELLQRAGKALANSSLIPEVYRGNLPNCIIALEMAQRIGASPLMVMQNLYIVYGRPAWSAKFLIACFNQCGRFSAVRYLWSGSRGKDDWGCQAWAIERETGEKIFGPVITMELVKAEGWYGRKDSKWKTIPEKMFMYRSAAWMIDTHAPELSMGIRTDDEVGDTYDATRGADGHFSVTTESLREVAGEVGAGADSPRQLPKAETAESQTSSDSIPHFDVATATDALKNSSTMPMLEESWKAVREDFAGTNRKMPVEVEAFYNDRRETLRQQGEKPL